MAKDRLQINIRVTDIDLEMIDALRRVGTPLPSITDVLLTALREKYFREIARDKDKRKDRR